MSTFDDERELAARAHVREECAAVEHECRHIYPFVRVVGSQVRHAHSDAMIRAAIMLPYAGCVW